MGWEYDKATYARISKAIAADPRHLSGKRLYDFIRELDLEDIPWDDANVQNEAGSFRIYHFRGFALYVNLYVPSEHWRDVAPQKILLEQGSPEEKRLGMCPSIPNCVLADEPCAQAESVRAQCGFPTFPPP
jgi:hypothetical protein